MYFYLVAPTKIVRHDASAFTYSFEAPLDIGTIVQIEVGKKNMIGVVLQQVKKPDFPVKTIMSIINAQPLPNHLVQLAAWMSSYYATHPALVWQTILPRGVDKKRRPQKSSVPTVSSLERTKKVFTREQSAALKSLQRNATSAALLHGVTGSGKTLIYIEMTKQALEQGKSAIVLVPEIALTSQLVQEFSAYFPEVVVVHSKQTESLRHRQWLQILGADKPLVIIGPRSALFMPVASLGLVVIDEFHEPSFKQELSPKYDAIEVAQNIMSDTKAQLILGSATPPVGAYHYFQRHNIPIIHLSRPAVQNAKKPQFSLVDMTKRDNFTEHFFLSNQLLTSLRKTLEREKQVLIFHNRRGSSAITLCKSCHWQAGCPRCFIPLTLHTDTHNLRCHICNFLSHVPTSCPRCKSIDIAHNGIGTKQIEQELHRLFPNKKIARFDADTPLDEQVHTQYDALKNGTIDIIIGTQVVAKGLDLPHLRTVGVVQADAGLSLPDYTSEERTFQLLAQVVGRVGRTEHETDVIIQTYQPDHYAITAGIRQDYALFYEQTLKRRKAAKFPPFSHILLLTCSYKTERLAITHSQEIAKKIKNVLPDGVIFGPTPAFYERKRDVYRWQVVVKHPSREALLELVSLVPATHWQYVIDPASLL